MIELLSFSAACATFEPPRSSLLLTKDCYLSKTVLIPLLAIDRRPHPCDQQSEDKQSRFNAKRHAIKIKGRTKG
jgi:hypothetical protein